MTAYAEKTKEFPWGKARLSIHSINRRFLDVVLDLPPELMQDEGTFRQLVSSFLFRGKVKVSLKLERETGGLVPNEKRTSALHSVSTKLAKILEVERQEIVLQLLPTFDCIEQMGVDEESLTDLKPFFDEILSQLVAMKEKEGAALQEDILSRLHAISKSLQEVEKKAPEATEKLRSKLKQLLSEFQEQEAENDERLLKEVAIYADRVDIEEEITRLKSHLKQFHEALNQPAGSTGKMLEFLLQEMLREVNTIGSKAQVAEVTALVVAMKSELERIREQLQNVE